MDDSFDINTADYRLSLDCDTPTSTKSPRGRSKDDTTTTTIRSIRSIRSLQNLRGMRSSRNASMRSSNNMNLIQRISQSRGGFNAYDGFSESQHGSTCYYFVIFFLYFVVGTIGYTVLFQEWSIQDTLYFAVTTFTTWYVLYMPATPKLWHTYLSTYHSLMIISLSQ